MSRSTFERQACAFLALSLDPERVYRPALFLSADENCHSVMIAGCEFRVTYDGIVEVHEPRHFVSSAAIKALSEIVPCAIERGIEVPRMAEGINRFAAECGSEHIGLLYLVRAENPAVIVADLEDIIGEGIIPALRKLRMQFPADISLIARRVPEANRISC